MLSIFTLPSKLTNLESIDTSDDFPARVRPTISMLSPDSMLKECSLGLLVHIPNMTTWRHQKIYFTVLATVWYMRVKCHTAKKFGMMIQECIIPWFESLINDSIENDTICRKILGKSKFFRENSRIKSIFQTASVQILEIIVIHKLFLKALKNSGLLWKIFGYCILLSFISHWMVHRI